MANLAVIGAGLAGCEAAWQAANLGVNVTIYEMKPEKFSPAHKSNYFAELVCSNSLRGDSLANGVGLLKEEMTRLNSLIMQSARATAVPAGGALAVDRDEFAKYITDKINGHPNITVKYGEISQIPQDGTVIIATGPLTDGGMWEEIQRLTGEEYLHFFDAAAPIVTAESIDMSVAYKAARYDKGGTDYINCPMNRQQYQEFYTNLVNGECSEIKEFENNVFEGCMPIEVMAKRGTDTMLFGPLKPVGLPRPDGTLPHAVVQLRQDNSAASLYNIVGFQTHLKFGEQKRIFSMIPGLEKAEIVRYGVMHRNSYINSPTLLNNKYQLKKDGRIFFAGQITGVEGYVESASSGLVAGLNAGKSVLGEQMREFSAFTATGSLANYISDVNIKKFQPMNINFGLLPNLDVRIKSKKDRYEAISKRALEMLQADI